MVIVGVKKQFSPQIHNIFIVVQMAMAASHYRFCIHTDTHTHILTLVAVTTTQGAPYSSGTLNIHTHFYNNGAESGAIWG